MPFMAHNHRPAGEHDTIHLFSLPGYENIHVPSIYL